MAPFNEFLNVDNNYFLTTADSVAYFFNILMKLLLLEDSSVLQRSKLDVGHKKIVKVVRMQCRLNTIRVPPLQKKPLLDAGHQKKKNSHSSTRQGTKVTDQASAELRWMLLNPFQTNTWTPPISCPEAEAVTTRSGIEKVETGSASR